MKIKNISAREILDSRGEPTVEVALTLANNEVIAASVPRGKSAGSYEAVAVPTQKAVRNINTFIAKKLRGMDVRKQKSIDETLCALDGTTTKKKLGGNTLLGVSIAVARAGAQSAGVPLWRYVEREAHVGRASMPRLFMNMINGGLHAGNNLDFQEYLVIPKTSNISGAIIIGVKLYRTLGKTLCFKKGETARNIGDEGGYAPMFKDNIEPLSILVSVAKRLGLHKKIDFGIDVAANSVKIKKEGLVSIYRDIKGKYPLIYIEDPFKENDFAGFGNFKKILGGNMLIAGDDLTVTNVVRMKKAKMSESINAVIIKPNQIGTVTESIEAVRLATKFGWKVVASHRSGETNDDFIADFAYGVGAFGLKLGAPARGERISKYNRLLEIERGRHE